MPPTPSSLSTSERPLRLWPGVLLVALLWLARFGLPAVLPELSLYGVMGGMGLGLAVVLWWLFFSRAPHAERWGVLAMLAAGLALTPRFLHPSVATGGMGMLFYIYVLPGACLALVLWAALSRGLAKGPRWVTMALAMVLAFGAWTLLRTGGISGSAGSDFAWRWSATAEERLLAEADAVPTAPALSTSGDAAPPNATPPNATPADATPADATPADATPADAALSEASPPTDAWPGFRGPTRDGVVPGIQIATDWSTTPPTELWRRKIGPGWSSFAVRGERIYTQEQRGDSELVSSYDATTGEPIWRHSDAVRFWESNAGAGPRATPTLAGDHVYTFGATGLLNALDAATGSRAWSRDVAADTDVPVPDWGFASSPLVVGDLVVVAAAGTLAAYDHATGAPRWVGPDGGTGYGSPHLATLGAQPQILLTSATGLTSVSLADGTLLWQHEWPGYLIVQPALTPGGDVLIGSDQTGTSRLAVDRGTAGWTVEERWSSNRLKPYFNDFVLHEGHAYGFDGGILACLDLEDGTRRWKGGRYGHGQLVLLPEQDLLLVITERGELALVQAAPERFEELARHPAIEGKTWNHPVLAGDVLLVRNGEEMAAFRVATERLAQTP